MEIMQTDFYFEGTIVTFCSWGPLVNYFFSLPEIVGVKNVLKKQKFF